MFQLTQRFSGCPKQSNYTHLHSVCTKNYARLANFPFTILIFFVLLFLICDSLFTALFFFRLVACISYSFCPCTVVLAINHKVQNVNSADKSKISHEELDDIYIPTLFIRIFVRVKLSVNRRIAFPVNDMERVNFGTA